MNQLRPSATEPATARDPLRWRMLAASCALMFASLNSPPLWAIMEPSTPQAFGASDIAYRLATSVPTLVFAACVLVAGVLGDLFGRRRWLLIRTVLFIAGNLIAMTAAGEVQFLLGRTLVALGGALIAPLVLALIRLTFDDAERTSALGIYTGVVGVGLIGGPILAQLLAGLAGWRSTFLIALVCAAAGGALAWYAVRESRANGGFSRADALATIGWSVVLLAIVFGLSMPNTGVYASSYALVALTIALLSGALLVWVGTRHPGREWRMAVDWRALTVVIVAGTLLYATFIGVFIQLNSFLALVQHYSPGAKILALLPLAPTLLIGGAVVTRLVRRLNRRGLLCLGFLLLAVAAGGLSLAAPDTGYAWLFVPILALGVGFSLGITYLTDILLSLISRDLAGSGSAIGGAVGRVGSALGLTATSIMLISFGTYDLVARLKDAGLSGSQISAAGNVLADALRHNLAGGEPDQLPAATASLVAVYEAAYATGFECTLQVTVVACLAGAALAWFGLQRMERQ